MKRLGLVIVLVACGGDKKETPAPAPAKVPEQAVVTPKPEQPAPLADDDQSPQTRQAQAAAAGSAAAGFARKDVHIALASRTAKDKSALTDEIVAGKITGSYAANIKRCYRAAVAKDPASQGSLTLDLTVGANGKTTAAKATGFPAAEVNACVERQMKVWRFPAPPDNTTPSFEIVLKLTPPA